MIRTGSGGSRVIASAFLVCLLAGCNAQSPPVASAPDAPAADPSQPQPAPIVALPAGSACAAAIGRWRDVIESDHQKGYTDPPVYASVQKDIAAEQTACAAGHDAQAVQMVRDSRRRHGYPLE